MLQPPVVFLYYFQLTHLLQMARPTNPAEYDHVLLLDLQPLPGYPHVGCYTYAMSGLPTDILQDFKVTRSLRLEPRRLAIYEEPHCYHIVAKCEQGCNTDERTRAARVVNDFLAADLRLGYRLDQAVERVVDNFPPRVLHRQMYLPKSDVVNKRPFALPRSRKRPAISSDETDGQTKMPPPIKVKKIRPKRSKSPPTRDPSPPRSPDAHQEDPAHEQPSVTLNNDGLIPVFYADHALNDDSKEVVEATADVLQATNIPIEVTERRSSPATPTPRSSTPSADDEKAAKSPSANVLHKQSSSDSDPLITISRPTVSNDRLHKLLDRLDVMDKKEDRRYEFTAGTLKFLSDGLDDIKTEMKHMKDAVKQLTAQELHRRVQESTCFPLEHKADVEAMAKSDAKLQQLFQRQVLI